MRLFEAALILINIASLFLILKNLSKKAWLGIASSNLLVFLVHGILEGFRYQMIFSYGFVLALGIYTLVKTSDKGAKIRIPKVIKALVIILTLVSVMLTSFLAYALPVFKLPKPTGGYAVGIKYFHLIDESRNDPFLDKTSKKRELMVKVYYPAVEDNSKPYSPYFHGSKELIRAFAAFYNMPDFMFDHLKLVKTNSKDNLPLSDKEKSYPLVLFSHGGGASMEIQTSQSEDLASHGYIVAAIDHTYLSAATVFPDRIALHHEATTNFNTPEPAEIITHIMADDSRFVIESLSHMNTGKIDTIFKGRFDMDKIGAIGHSLGGAVAYDLAINENRIKAAINLDGRVFVTPKEYITNAAPFLMLANDKNHIQTLQSGDSLLTKFEEFSPEEQANILPMYGSKEAYNEAALKAQQNSQGLYKILKNSGNLYTITGSDHMKFTDLGLFIGVRQLRELIQIGGETAPARCLVIGNAISAAFFDHHLKGERSISPESLVEKYSELKKVQLN